MLRIYHYYYCDFHQAAIVIVQLLKAFDWTSVWAPSLASMPVLMLWK
jgi:hypothetical protein